jgi:hypothetical protein
MKIGARLRQRHESCKVSTKCGAGCTLVNYLPEVRVYKDGIRSFTIGPLGLLVLTLAMFFDVLFLPGDTVLSNARTDLASQFVHWRGFGFGEMSRGNLPLWNPHVYGGAPFLAGFQSALLYPLNVLYLVLPRRKRSSMRG